MSVWSSPRLMGPTFVLLLGCSSSTPESPGTAAGGSEASGGSVAMAASGAPTADSAGALSGVSGESHDSAGTGGASGDRGLGGANAGSGGAEIGGAPASSAGTDPGAGAAATSAGSSGSPSASCPAEQFLCENFESYPIGSAPNGIWTKTTRGAGAIVVDETRAFSGARSLHATGTLNADVAHITTPLSISANIVYVRFMMYTVSYPSSSGVHSRLARIGTVGDAGPDSSYSLSSYNGTAIEKVDSIYLRSTAVHLDDAAYKNKWICVEFEIDKSGGVGKVVPYIWIDGAALSLSKAGSSTHANTSDSWDPIPFQKFTIGLEGNQVDAIRGDYWLDDLVIAPQRAGCPAK